MPQKFHVLRCYKCKVFQVHIVKKAKKWECKICGDKQSLTRTYGEGDGKECRLHVQRLNEMRAGTEHPIEVDNKEDNVPIIIKVDEEKSRWKKHLERPELGGTSVDEITMEPKDAVELKIKKQEIGYMNSQVGVASHYVCSKSHLQKVNYKEINFDKIPNLSETNPKRFRLNNDPSYLDNPMRESSEISQQTPDRHTHDAEKDERLVPNTCGLRDALTEINNDLCGRKVHQMASRAQSKWSKYTETNVNCETPHEGFGVDSGCLVNLRVSADVECQTNREVKIEKSQRIFETCDEIDLENIFAL